MGWEKGERVRPAWNEAERWVCLFSKALLHSQGPKLPHQRHRPSVWKGRCSLCPKIQESGLSPAEEMQQKTKQTHAKKKIKKKKSPFPKAPKMGEIKEGERS